MKILIQFRGIAAFTQPITPETLGLSQDLSRDATWDLMQARVSAQFDNPEQGFSIDSRAPLGPYYERIVVNEHALSLIESDHEREKLKRELDTWFAAISHV